MGDICRLPTPLFAGNVARDSVDRMVGPDASQLPDVPFVGVELLGEPVRIPVQQSVTYIHHFAWID